MREKFRSSSRRRKFIIGFGVAFALLVTVAALSPQQPVSKSLHSQNTSSAQSTPQTKMPTVTYRTTTETKSVPFTNTNINDNSLPQGQTQITTAGVNGTETLTYKITYTNGQQTDKQLVSDAVTTPPINQTTQIGTYVAPAVTAPASTDATTTSCHPLTNGGNCYEPGEYCRASDHGLTGLAGDGKVIVCADNDGWRWEPN